MTIEEELGRVKIQQSRFLSSGDVRAEEDDTTWWVPLGFDTIANATESLPSALTTKYITFEGLADASYKLNTKQSGFYRTNYPAARLARLGQSQTQLSSEDKIGLIADAAALAVAGDGKTSNLLSFAESFKAETNYQ